MHEDPENPGVNLSDFINILNACFKCVEEMKFCTKKKPHKWPSHSRRLLQLLQLDYQGRTVI